MKKPAGLFLSLASLILYGFGLEKPDFSGVWEINNQKSQLADWAKFDRTTITIDHKEPIFVFRRVSIKADKTEESSFELTTDGAEKVVKEGNRTNYSRLSWDGDALVFHTRIVIADGRETTNTVRYTLQDEGKTFMAEEKFRGPVVKYDNLWVADKK